MAEFMHKNAGAKQEHDNRCDVEDVDQVHGLDAGKRFVTKHVDEFHDGAVDWVPFRKSPSLGSLVFDVAVQAASKLLRPAFPIANHLYYSPSWHFVDGAPKLRVMVVGGIVMGDGHAQLLPWMVCLGAGSHKIPFDAEELGQIMLEPSGNQPPPQLGFTLLYKPLPQ